jgi:hypothetical protein
LHDSPDRVIGPGERLMIPSTRPVASRTGAPLKPGSMSAFTWNVPGPQNVVSESTTTWLSTFVVTPKGWPMMVLSADPTGRGPLQVSSGSRAGVRGPPVTPPPVTSRSTVNTDQSLGPPPRLGLTRPRTTLVQ